MAAFCGWRIPAPSSPTTPRRRLLRPGSTTAARGGTRGQTGGKAYHLAFGCLPSFSFHGSYQVKYTRSRPIFVLETDGGSPTSDGQDIEEDRGFLGRTRLGRLIQAAARELLEKLNSARINTPTKIFLVLLGFYNANALSTILGQTGDWDVLVAAVIVAAIEGIGMLVYKISVARPPGRFKSLIEMVNYWKAGVCLGLFVDAFKVGS